jgi:hypothetical protein
MELCCSLCLYDPLSENEAGVLLTIINGHLVCEGHCGYVQGGDWSLALATIRNQLAAIRSQ